MSVVRWLLPAVVPAVLLALVLYKTDREREPPAAVVGTFLLGALFAAAAFFVEAKVAALTGLTVRASQAGEAGALLFLFALVAPLREAAKVSACWPAFRSRYFDEPYDGVVYASAAALGFAAAENAVLLRGVVLGGGAYGIALTRALFALPAHLFFASLWGYALGRAKRSKRPGAIFPTAWLGATAAHGFYVHFVYGRGPGALVAVLPLLLAMGIVALVAARDLRARGERPSRVPASTRLSPVYARFSSRPPSFRAVRDALRRRDRPLVLRWVVYGALVTVGAMVLGLGLAVWFGHLAQVDFSIVDEHDVATTAPVALLGAGVLAAFPVSGFLIARAGALPGLLEPALATALALGLGLVLLGLAAPVAVVFALASSPVAFGLACAGAWIGRPHR